MTTTLRPFRPSGPPARARVDADAGAGSGTPTEVTAAVSDNADIGGTSATTHGNSPWPTVLWITLPLSAFALAMSMSTASFAAAGDSTSFALYWFGMGLAVVPGTVALLSNRTRDSDRAWIVVALAVMSCLPKFLAFIGRPAFFDETAHWTQVERLVADGRQFAPNNQVVVIGDYPAMHFATSLIRQVTGLSTHASSLVIVVTFHLLTLAAVWTAGRRLTGTPHGAGVAALFYLVGPGYWYFNTQFAYESMGVALVSWTMAGFAHLLAADVAPRRRHGWYLLILLVGLVLTATHHLSSYLNLAIVWAFALAAVARRYIVRAPTTDVGESVLLAVTLTAAAGLWLFTQAPHTRSYLAPHIQEGLSDMVGLVEAGDSARSATEPTQARQLFSGSTLPLYEQIAGFIAPLVSAALLALGSLGLWRRGIRGAHAIGVALVSALYVVVYPLMFSAAGAEGARRSWSFTNLALSAVIAGGTYGALTSPRRGRRRLTVGALGISAVILLVGNIAVGINEAYRFPGPYLYGSDTRSVTDEAIAAGRWIRRHEGANQPVVGDRGAVIVLATEARGHLVISTVATPYWNLLLDSTPPDRSLEALLANGAVAFLLVDHHQAVDVPATKFILDENEPGAADRTGPLSADTVTKFDGIGYMIRVYSSNWYSLYRILPSEIDSGKVGS